MTPLPANGRIFSAISRTRTGKALVRLGETRAISAQTAETEAHFKAEVSKAKYFRQRSRHEEALTRFRRALLTSPKKSHTWVDYGHTAINCGRLALAYEAFLNALELDPTNVGALEMAVDLAPKLGIKPVETRRLLSKTSKHAVADKSARHLDLLDFFIPFGISLPAEVFENSTNTSAQALFALQVKEGANNSALESLDEPDRTAVLSRFYLLRGRYSAAEKALNKLTPEAIPVDTLRRMARRLTNTGNHQKVKFAARYLLRADRNDKWARQKLESAEASYRNSAASSEKRSLLDSGFPLPTRAAARPAPKAGPILYLLHNSLPYNSAGYATRSHGLISNIARQGYPIAGVTRPGYPFDRPEAKHSGAPLVESDIVDGVEYLRLSTHEERMPKSPLVPYVYEYANRLSGLCRSRNARLVHAASNHWNGLAAVVAANSEGLPSIYEVRGLWEITRISREPEWRDSLDYAFMSEMEATAAKAATRVLTITHALKRELVGRGVDESKISVIPNGVDTERFIPIEPDMNLKRSLGLDGKIVIGYVGSILDYEGIDVLIDAIRILSLESRDFHALVVGDGDNLQNAKQRVIDMQLEALITFTGRVPHEEVERYYSIIDIAPIPRHSLPVTEMVSPLKPFEAMAMGKVVVGSDVDAIKEIIVPGVNGMLFAKDNAPELASVLSELINDRDKTTALGISAREWVVAERDWSHIARDVAEVYDQLL